ncbi:NAD(P)-dependent oxidoreductase [Novosphingobium sp. KN65.2]|uniref:NAD-dependent epimerase/dehydratase family protein n=1 Tax=Novosphingobium sp. KN65.2 TaxID=1478134 RepID=UPI0005DCCB1F|nr:NAD-dependent epimerase/dehydratase family protein [Novosphingobium sp. KN65.2]CDO34477.1 NAD-dependent epimerase/dehydratase [Novosphingobium sp. KN65.2]
MSKKVLVVGGTGALGGHAAIHLAGLGHQVTVAGRNTPSIGTSMADMPFLKGDYVAGDFTPERLRGFDWVVFAAGNDPRHIPQGSDIAAHFMHANAESIPAFFAAAREAGVTRAIQLGSFYPQASPELVAGNVYIQSRKAACEGARAQGCAGFDVISVNAPFMVGTVPGLPSAIFEPYVQWALGQIPIEHFAPPGGTNFMSFRSLSEAIAGALERGEPGKAYLVGDENLTFREYFQLFFDAVGSTVVMEERDAELPLLPDVAIPQGRGNTIAYEPDADEVALLGYTRNDIAAAVRDIVAQFAVQSA